MFRRTFKKRFLSKISSPRDQVNNLGTIPVTDERLQSAHPGRSEGTEISVSKPLPLLPVEIWAQIIQLLSRFDRRLYPLLLVNWTLHGEAARVIYRCIVVDERYHLTLVKPMNLFCLLAEEPRYACLVQSFGISWRTFSDGPFKEYGTAANLALRSMANLRILRISSWCRELNRVNIGFLLNGCNFHLDKLRLLEAVEQDIRLLEPHVAELRELQICDQTFEGSKFPKLRVLSVLSGDQQLLNSLRSCTVMALWWWGSYGRTLQLDGDPYPPLRSLGVSIHQHASIVGSISRVFPSLRYLSLSFWDREIESLDLIPSCLHDLYHLKFLSIEHPYLKAQDGSLNAILAQESICAVPSLLFVFVGNLKLFRRGETRRPSRMSWNDEMWWN